MKVDGYFILALKMSYLRKCEADWSRKVSRGFIAEEILEASRDKITGNITLVMEGYTIDGPIVKYNLQETEEILKWAEYQDGRYTTPARKIPHEE